MTFEEVISKWQNNLTSEQLQQECRAIIDEEPQTDYPVEIDSDSFKIIMVTN